MEFYETTKNVTTQKQLNIFTWKDIKEEMEISRDNQEQKDNIINKGGTLMWQQGHYMGPDGRIQSGAATLAHSITGHEMDEDMDTGGQEQVIFDMDQGFPPSGYTQEQMDEIN